MGWRQRVVFLILVILWREGEGLHPIQSHHPTRRPNHQESHYHWPQSHYRVVEV